jgi:predicted histone-like DNA-binding protein
MSVKYNLSERGNPLKPEEPKKWYAGARNTGDVSLRTLGKEIVARSTVNRVDTMAVLQSLTEVLVEHLSDGKIVRLGDFGAFQVGIGSDGAPSADKFHDSMIKNQKVIFRPGTDLKEMLNNLTFEKL